MSLIASQEGFYCEPLVGWQVAGESKRVENQDDFRGRIRRGRFVVRMEGQDLLGVTAVEKREVAVAKATHRISGLVRDDDNQVDQAFAVIEEGLLARSLGIGRGRCGGYRLRARRP